MLEISKIPLAYRIKYNGETFELENLEHILKYNIPPAEVTAALLDYIYDADWVVKGTGYMKQDNTGRGRYDLVDYGFIYAVDTDLLDGDVIHLVRHLAKRLEEGAIKYSPNNWKKSKAEDHHNSFLRHTTQYLNGETDEDHLAAMACNLMFIYVLNGKDCANYLPGAAIDASEVYQSWWQYIATKNPFYIVTLGSFVAQEMMNENSNE